MNSSDALSRTDCLRLLGQRTFGRVAFTQRALPAILPVSYALLGQDVLLHSAVKGLGRRLDGQVLALQVDDLDAQLTSGWSVVVTGVARLVSAPAELARYDAVRLRPGAGPGRDDRVCLTTDHITGRRFMTTSSAR